MLYYIHLYDLSLNVNQHQAIYQTWDHSDSCSSALPAARLPPPNATLSNVNELLPGLFL